MVNVLVSVKQSVDVDSVRINRDTGTLTTVGVPRKMNDFDKNALEEAIRIKEKMGGKVVAVSVGQPSVKDVLKEALSMGADEAHYVTEPSLQEFDSRGVALVLSKLFGALGPFDLVLMGEGSVDHYSSQVDPDSPSCSACLRSHTSENWRFATPKWWQKETLKTASTSSRRSIPP